MTREELISHLRSIVGDKQNSNVVWGESPKGNNDGSNKVFRLQIPNIVPETLFMTVNTSVRFQTGFSVDPDNGIITFDTAPASAANPFLADYCHYWFDDDEHLEFLNEGTRALGQTVPTGVVDGLLPALYQYAAYHYYTRRASMVAHRYPSSGGQVGHSVDSVVKNFLMLATAAMKNAVTLRDDYYKRQGQREAPSSGTVNYGFDPISPMR